ncbi:hypothetical protein [Mycolicibacterium sp.]|uniref:hypothetical protein n=1 Tax=Mycolicibacterium sp. TaxID=2320850 RepID=UPI001DA219F4|nr:hypothetical protein [Mycolicibacterium sp.]MCB1292175.1 hypothetical protein [Mycobacterium sp.]MCB9408425.1 hypothetical protein [Mycolicibacterium sp.]
MVWIAPYGVVVIAVAVATFLFTELVREPHMTDRNRLEILAVLTGLLWPVMVVGLLELVLLVVIRSMLRLRDPMVVPGAVGVGQPVELWGRGA